MSFISLIIVKCALKHTGVVAKKSNLIAPLPPLMPSIIAGDNEKWRQSPSIWTSVEKRKTFCFARCFAL